MIMSRIVSGELRDVDEKGEFLTAMVKSGIESFKPIDTTTPYKETDSDINESVNDMFSEVKDKLLELAESYMGTQHEYLYELDDLYMKSKYSIEIDFSLYELIRMLIKLVADRDVVLSILDNDGRSYFKFLECSLKEEDLSRDERIDFCLKFSEILKRCVPEKWILDNYGTVYKAAQILGGMDPDSMKKIHHIAFQYHEMKCEKQGEMWNDILSMFSGEKVVSIFWNLKLACDDLAADLYKGGEKGNLDDKTEVMFLFRNVAIIANKPAWILHQIEKSIDYWSESRLRDFLDMCFAEFYDAIHPEERDMEYISALHEYKYKDQAASIMENIVKEGYEVNSRYDSDFLERKMEEFFKRIRGNNIADKAAGKDLLGRMQYDDKASIDMYYELFKYENKFNEIVQVNRLSKVLNDYSGSREILREGSSLKEESYGFYKLEDGIMSVYDKLGCKFWVDILMTFPLEKQMPLLICFYHKLLLDDRNLVMDALFKIASLENSSIFSEEGLMVRKIFGSVVKGDFRFCCHFFHAFAYSYFIASDAEESRMSDFHNKYLEGYNYSNSPITETCYAIFM